MNFIDKIISKIKYNSKVFHFVENYNKGAVNVSSPPGVFKVINPEKLDDVFESLDGELSSDILETVTAGIPASIEDIPISMATPPPSPSFDLDDTLEMFPVGWDFPDEQDTTSNEEEVPLITIEGESLSGDVEVVDEFDDPFWKELDELVLGSEKKTKEELNLKDEFSSGFGSSNDDVDVLSAKPVNSSFFKKAGDLPDFEPKLATNVTGPAQASFVTPEPVKAGPSLFDKKFVELVGMDIEEVKSTILAEVKALEHESSEYRKVQLQKIFSKLLSYQPMSEYGRSYSEDEQRFYAEVIATPGLITEPYVVSFLRDDFYAVHNQADVKRNLLLRVSDYYLTHSQDAIDKFNYVFMSTDYVSTFFLDNPDISIDKYFSDRITSMFDKEDLSLLYRFYLNSGSYQILDNLFTPEKDKALFMMSILNKKVKQLTGHSVEFLDCAILLMNSDNKNLVPLLESFYDKLVVDKESEKASESVLLQLDNVAGVKDLINFIIESKYDRGRNPLDKITDYDSFVAGVSDLRERRHDIILGDGGVEKVKMGLFKREDLPKASSFYYDETERFVSAFLKNVYGISLNSARYFSDFYGKHLKSIEATIPPKPIGMSDSEYLASLDESKMAIMKKDLPIFNMLKTICSLSSLDYTSPDFASKLEVLQMAYLSEMQKKGFDYQNPYASFSIVEGALNNMYMNSYNKLLCGKKDAVGSLEVHDGVELLDAGVKFDMLVTSLGGVSNIFDDNVDMASKWNTASMSRGQGICSSHISSQNLGVIDLSAPILGFVNLPEYSLDMMGTSDIWTDITAMNLRKDNKATPYKNRYFVPGHIMSDETRYGYNEILIDRFAATSSAGDLKLQPDYLLYFKFEEDFHNDYYYRMAHKTAKDFGVPIMVVDVKKIKEHESSVLSGMRDELFSSDTVNPDLVHDILMRYMNNYTGSLTFVGKNMMYEDFSVDAMRTFVNEIFNKAISLGDPEEAKAWIAALDSAYQDEKRKYEEAINAGGYKYSVRSFILETYDVEGKIGRYYNGEEYDPDKTAEMTAPLPMPEKTGFKEKVLDDGTNVIMIPDSQYNPMVQSCVDFVIAMGMGSDISCVSEFDSMTGELINLVHVEEPEDKQMFVVENLVVAYLYEDMDNAITSDIIWNKCNLDVNFNSSSSFDFNAAVFESPFKDLVLEGEAEYTFSFEKAEQYIAKIESMSSQEFLQIFTPAIMKKSTETGVPFEDISSRMLDKKDTIREKFEILQKQVAVAKAGGDPLDVIEDSKRV